MVSNPTLVTEPLLLKAAQVAKVMGCSLAYVYQLYSAGRLPEPVRLGGRAVRWRKDELSGWINAGCPSRDKWERSRKTEISEVVA